MAKCGAVGALMVGGRVVGQIRCELDAGHDSEAALFGDEWTPHRMTLEWTPEAEPDLDLFDPDEHFDADVPMLDDAPASCPHTTVGRCFRCAIHD